VIYAVNQQQGNSRQAILKLTAVTTTDSKAANKKSRNGEEAAI